MLLRKQPSAIVNQRTTMKIINALKASVNYPLSEDNVMTCLIGRGLDPKDDFESYVAESKEYQLAYADLLRFVCTMVNLSQGGGSVSQAAVGELRGTANAIYKKYGEKQIGESADTKSTLTIGSWFND